MSFPGYSASLFSLLLLLVLQTSNCANVVVVDGVNQWNNPTANIGDTIIFKHKNQYNLYIFRTKDAFSSCNFTQATALSNPNNSTYTWHPSRIGHFYFAFYNGSNVPCEEGEKLAVEIRPTESPSPTATPGGVYPWPNQPREKEKASPGPTYNDVGISPMPFINSNPAVPLPTGEVDSATIQPLPTSASNASKGVKVMGWIKGVKSLCYGITVVVIVISFMSV